MECASSQGFCPMTGAANPPSKRSAYMPGMSPAVIFVAALSSVAFFGVILAAGVVTTIQSFFFLLLPLAAAGSGAFLIASPEMSPLGAAASDPTVLLLVRAVGALALAYSAGAMLVGGSGCPKSRCMHLKLMTAVLGALTFAISNAEGAAIPAESRELAQCYLVRMTAAAFVGSVIAAAGPSLTTRIQAGKPVSPAISCS